MAGNSPGPGGVGAVGAFAELWRGSAAQIFVYGSCSNSKTTLQMPIPMAQTQSADFTPAQQSVET